MRQPKLFEYLNKNKTGFDPSKKPPGLFNSRHPDAGSREGSDAQTQKLSDHEFGYEAQEPRECCPLFLLITPHDLANFASTHSKLQALSKKSPSKGQILSFIREQIRVRASIARVESVNLKNLEDIDSTKFWERAAPLLIRRASEKKLKEIRLLIESSNGVVTITRGDAFTILSHMFLCTMPEQFFKKDVCFNEYFNGIGFKPQNRAQKLKCLVAYFQAMLQLSTAQLDQYLIFQRVSGRQKSYMQTPMRMSNMQIVYRNIEQHKGQLMVDFANKNIGGGVLKNGCVQEEILFITHPEMFISCLLYDTLGDHECALMHGCYQYAKYQGYSGSFKYTGPFHQRTNLDMYGKHYNTYIVVDAVNYNDGVFKNNPGVQYKDGLINRQIHKAYLGFSNSQYLDESLTKKRIITGKWGCGAFGGDPELKMVIQWLAASWANRDLVFVDWGKDEEQFMKSSNFNELIDLLKNMDTTEVRRLLKKYSQFRIAQKVKIGLCDYVAEFFV